MSDDYDYEYEVMRAELLGLPKPERKPLPSLTKNDDDNGNLEDLEIQNEELGRVSGGIDELNSILSVTQKKINRFKSVCGSLTNLLKVKIGAGKDDTSSDCSSQASVGDSTFPADDVPGASCGESSTITDGTESEETIKTTSTRNLELEGKLTSRDLDLEGKLTRGIDKLDSILIKSEEAEISMSRQNKEMRSFLR